MQKLSDKINMTAEPPGSDGKKNSLPGSWIEVWRAGVVTFGDKWTMKHGEKPSGEWNQVFLNLEPHRIQRAVANMRKDAEAKIKSGDEAWPPNAFEFACLGKRNSSLYFPANMPPGGDRKLLTQKTEFDELTPAECVKAAKRMLGEDDMLSDQHQRAVEIMHECKMDYLEIYEDFYRQGIQVEISDIKAQTDRLDGSRRRIDKLILEYHGQVLTLREWSEITGIQWNTLRMRMRRGWSATDILRTPAKRGNNATVRQQ